MLQLTPAARDQFKEELEWEPEPTYVRLHIAPG